MKSLVFALVVSALLAMPASGQVKSQATASNETNSKPSSVESVASATRVRVLKQAPVLTSGAVTQINQVRPVFNNHTDARFRRTNPPVDSANRPGTVAYGSQSTAHSALKPRESSDKIALPVNSAVNVTNPIKLASTQVYRVGPGDVLDITLAGNPARNSTLFTVLDDGVLEYPLAVSPIVVGGLTTSEIAALLRQRIKVFDNPKVQVEVRDYASHTVSIVGFVAAPGTKVMRREAMPLYTLLAEALVLPDASFATITREGQTPLVIDLKDKSLSGTLVVPGDAIKVTGLAPAPAEFFFVGGEISFPGQKPYHAGLTLTQAILASGGTTNNAGSRVRVSRAAPDGRLSTEEFNLRKIQTGKTPDPVLQAGDRIEVTTGN